MAAQYISTESTSQAAQHCCKGDQPFQWENPEFDPPYIPNPLIFLTKICTDDYVWHISRFAKFGENPFMGGFPMNRLNITLP